MPRNKTKYIFPWNLIAMYSFCVRLDFISLFFPSLSAIINYDLKCIILMNKCLPAGNSVQNWGFSAVYQSSRSFYINGKFILQGYLPN